MSGSPAFAIQRTEGFDQSLRAILREHYKKDPKGEAAFIELLGKMLMALTATPRPGPSRPEPWPRTGTPPATDKAEFRKVTFNMPGLSGSAREGRLMYLVSRTESWIRPVIVYTHKQFEGRPSEKSLDQLVQDAIAYQEAAAK